MRLYERLRIQRVWDTLQEQDKNTYSDGWQSSRVSGHPERPGRYNRLTQQFAFDGDTWTRIDHMFGIVPITKKDWTAPSYGYVYKVLLSDNNLVFWFTRSKINLEDLILSGYINDAAGRNILAGDPLANDWLRDFPDAASAADDPVIRDPVIGLRAGC